MIRKSILLPLFIALGAVSILAEGKSLKFNKDNGFKIVQFTDVHWIPNDARTGDTKQCMEQVLETEKPDFVIYTGDIFTGTPLAQAVEEVLQLVVSRNIPFAVTFGNHDDEHDLTRAQLFELLKKYPNNLTSTVEGLSGVSNFILEIQGSKNATPAALIYCLDSHAYSPLQEIKGYNWIKPDQIAWYTAQSKAYTHANSGMPLPALAFFHIPLPEYNLAAADENAKLIGSRREKACAPALNSGLFTAILSAGDVMATFVGHDHVNDYATYWKGILLCYGRFTGGKTTYCDIPEGNGARVIELTEGSRSFKSWIRLNNNQRINALTYPDDFVKK